MSSEKQLFDNVKLGRHVKRDGFVHVAKRRLSPRADDPSDDFHNHPKTIDLGPVQQSTTTSTSTTSIPTPTPPKPVTTSSLTTSTSTSSSVSKPTTTSSTTSATTSATTSSSTTSKPTTTTSTTPVQTHTSTTAAAVTTPVTTAKALTPTFASTTLLAQASASASSTSTPDDDSSISGGLIGGIAGAIGGLALIALVVLYFLRRKRNDGYNENADFNPDAFRSQSVMLPDDDRPSRRGPRPPTMIERHVANSPATLGPNQYNYPLPPPPAQYAQGGYGNPFGNQYQMSFNPGDVMSPGPGPGSPSPPPPSHSPYTPNTAQPFFGQYAQSPIASPMTPVGYNNIGQPALSRQPSGGSRAPMSPGGQDDHYVDLNRSSVTPFQAQQYEEISRRLGADGMADISEEAEAVPSPPPKEKETPLTDPALRVPATPAPPYSDYDPHSVSEELPAPPSPVHTSHSRVPSSPPLLPEIELHNRPFSPMDHSYDFPSSAKASTFDIPSPKLDAEFAAAGPGPSAKAPPSQLRNVAAMRPETVYDPEDAYGGI